MRKRTVITADIGRKIDELASVTAKPSPSNIARKLGLKSGTVNWYMLTNGLLSVKPPSYSNKPYTRNGLTIYPYSAEHDAMLLAMRVENKTFQQIAAALVEAFGIPRNAHSVHNRAVMLAAVDDESEAA